MIKRLEKGWLKVPCYYEEAGLLVTPSTTPMGEIVPNRFRITHAASGRTLGTVAFTTQEEAIRALRAIAPLTDWWQSFKTLQAKMNTDKQFSEKYFALMHSNYNE